MTSNAVDETQYNEALRILKDDHHFEFVKDFRRGRYGVTLSMKNSRHSNIAVYITSNVGKQEAEIWPRLLHPNIIPLYDSFCLRNGLTAFVMPQTKCSLINLVKNETFRSKERSFLYVGKWIYHLLCGLHYLHRKHMYHLDIRVGNEQVSHNGTALLCNFRYTTEKDMVAMDEIGMSGVYVPPEIFYMESQYDIKHPEFNSRHLDLWGFGIMSLEAFTMQAISHNPERQRDQVWKEWNVDIKPFLQRIEHETGFLLDILRRVYHSSSVGEDDAASLKRFVKLFLNEKPDCRVRAKEALGHDFLKSWNRSYSRTKSRGFSTWSL